MRAARGHFHPPVRYTPTLQCIQRPSEQAFLHPMPAPHESGITRLRCWCEPSRTTGVQPSLRGSYQSVRKLRSSYPPSRQALGLLCRSKAGFGNPRPQYARGANQLWYEAGSARFDPPAELPTSLRALRRSRPLRVATRFSARHCGNGRASAGPTPSPPLPRMASRRSRGRTSGGCAPFRRR